MSDLRNALLLAALKRAGKPLASDDLLDHAVALALDEGGWTPERLAFNRMVVSKRLGDMERANLVRKAVAKVDDRNRRETPTYEPVDGWDATAYIPLPSRARDAAPVKSDQAASPFSGYSPRQCLVLLDAQDALLESMSRALQNIHAGIRDIAETREKVRARLAAEGLGAR